MDIFTGMEVAVPLNHRSLACISSGTDHTLPICCITPFGSHVVAVTKAVQQFGFAAFGSVFHKLEHDMLNVWVL